MSKRVKGKFSEAPAPFPLVLGARQRALFTRWTLEKMHLQDYGKVWEINFGFNNSYNILKSLPDTRLSYRAETSYAKRLEILPSRLKSIDSRLQPPSVRIRL